MRFLKFFFLESSGFPGFLPGVPYILVDGKPVEQPNDLLKEAWGFAGRDSMGQLHDATRNHVQRLSVVEWPR